MRISDWSSDVCSSDLEMLRRAKFKPRFLSSHEDGIWLHLAEIDGFVAAEDSRLEMMSARDAVKRVMLIGSYALPLGNAAVRLIRASGTARAAEGTPACRPPPRRPEKPGQPTRSERGG